MTHAKVSVESADQEIDPGTHTAPLTGPPDSFREADTQPEMIRRAHHVRDSLEEVITVARLGDPGGPRDGESRNYLILPTRIVGVQHDRAATRPTTQSQPTWQAAPSRSDYHEHTAGSSH